MTIEATLNSALGALVGGRAFPAVAPDSTPAPWITWQQVGGDSTPWADATVAQTRNARIQVSVWSPRVLEAAALSRQAETTLVETLRATPLGGAVSTYEPDTKRHGYRQFFSVWF